MRINSTKPLNLPNLGGWEHEYLLLEDCTCTEQGIVNLDVIDDRITQRELFDVKSDGTEIYWEQRKIVGEIGQFLPNWQEMMAEMPSVSLPEEASVYESGEASATFDPKDRTLSLTVKKFGA